MNWFKVMPTPLRQSNRPSRLPGLDRARHSPRPIKPVLGALTLVLATVLAGLNGCEVDSFLDPSNVGSWENTPQMVPILDQLAVINEGSNADLPRTPVRPADLKVDRSEYVIGSGDTLTITIFELVTPGQPSVQTRRVNESGKVRLPVIGAVQAGGNTPSQLEKNIKKTLADQGVLTQNPTVSVVVSQARQRTYSIVGAPNANSTAFGTYVIPKPDFRLLQALALARGVPGRTRTLLIFRQNELSKEVTGEDQVQTPTNSNQPPAEENSANVIQQLEGALEGGNQPAPGQATNPNNANPGPGNGANTPGPGAANGGPGQGQGAQGGAGQAPPSDLDTGLSTDQGSPNWLKVGGQWVRAGQVPKDVAKGKPSLEEALGDLVTQRIIEVPYQKLVNGDMRYNIVVRPDDVIRVPDPTAGFVYAMGAINRPGAYNVPGEKELTLKQLIASAGNLSGLAIPQRVDLTRRIDEDYEATVRLNLKEIFHGNEPDIFLKPNDLINVGTNFPATPIAVFRNGLRASYGFGFIVDRNFGPDIFGERRNNRF